MSHLPACMYPPTLIKDTPTGQVIEHTAILQSLESYYPIKPTKGERWSHVHRIAIAPMLTPGYILLKVWVSKYLKLPVYIPLKTYDVDMAAQIYYNIAIPARQRQQVYDLVNFYLKRPYANMFDQFHEAYVNRYQRLIGKA